MSRRARRAEMLDAETERQLALAWRERRDEAALHRLITAYTRLAVAMAVRFRRYGVPKSDLVQQAALGLLKAADRFDPDRGVRFSTYAAWWIRAEMQDFVMRDWSLVRTGSTSGQKSLFFNLARVRARVERAARDAGEHLDGRTLQTRIARELGVTEAEVALMAGRMAGTDASLNAVLGGEEEGRAWIDLLEDEGPQAAETVAARHDSERLRNWLAAAFRVLNPRERLIVTERQLSEAPRTLESLAGELGLSKERIRQLEAGAFAKMRRWLEGQAPEVRALLA